MIPKIIHYCWFGGKSLPPLALKCIESWKKFLPGYKIIEWNEHNYDVFSIPYTSEAYKKGKFAFVSDYARFDIIYKYGGIYFDTDVEVIQNIDDILTNGCFMGFEADPDGKNSPHLYAPRFSFAVNPGIGFGMTKEHPFIKEMLNLYSNLNFDDSPLNPWYKTIVAYTTEQLCTHGLSNKKGIQTIDFQGNSPIRIYPSQYFSPINIISKRLHITYNTKSIHHFLGNWDGDTQTNKSFLSNVKKYMINAIPEWIFFAYNKLKRQRYQINK